MSNDASVSLNDASVGHLVKLHATLPNVHQLPTLPNVHKVQTGSSLFLVSSNKKQTLQEKMQQKKVQLAY